MEKNINFAEFIERRFTEEEFSFNIKRYEHSTVFIIPIPAKNAPNIIMSMRISDMHVKLFAEIAHKTPKNKRIQILEILNSLLNRFKYIQLVLEDDDSICASYDFDIFSEDEETIMKQVITNLYLIQNIIDECIPKIMMIIWNNDEEKLTEEED